MARIHNFNPGPAALPETVLREAQRELLDYQDCGMSILELSHRSSDYRQLHTSAKHKLRQLLDIPSSHEVLFLQGGASMQFAMIPLNFLPHGSQAEYILTGLWSEKALAEAERVGTAHASLDSKQTGYDRIPDPAGLDLERAAYVHLTSNNTIYGTQWQVLPRMAGTPFIADMSSDLLSRPINVSDFALIYAGAQKNFGPAGVTVVIVDKAFLAAGNANIPAFLRYQTHVDTDSLYNTPPTFSTYVLTLVLRWIQEQGGLREMERRNREKAEQVYAALDRSQGFYRGHAQLASRSVMNVTFMLPSEKLTERFLAGALEAGLVGIQGHRSVGGCRVSLYNAVSRKACEALVDYMECFRRQN